MQWKEAAADVDDHTLRILGQPVMEDWEVPYMEKLAAIAAKSGGTVLEVGFGMGISARFIQMQLIQKHLIIEANREVASHAREFASKATHPTEVLEGLWEEVAPTIQNDSIDGILFDTYPLTKDEIHKNHFAFFKTAYRILKRGGFFTYYSDEISDFSPEHRQLLADAGFASISKEIVSVEPPAQCQYWRSPTIIAPIIQK